MEQGWKMFPEEAEQWRNKSTGCEREREREWEKYDDAKDEEMQDEEEEEEEVNFFSLYFAL